MEDDLKKNKKRKTTSKKEKRKTTSKKILKEIKDNLAKISADADGGPRSRVRTAGHSA